MFAFVKNFRGDKIPVVAGDALRKIASKAMAIEFRIPWKESRGIFKYGLNTPEGVNVMVLMVQDSLAKNADRCACGWGKRVQCNQEAESSRQVVCNLPCISNLC